MMAPSLMGSCAIFGTRESVVGEVTVGAPAGVDRAGTVGREFLLGLVLAGVLEPRRKAAHHFRGCYWAPERGMSYRNGRGLARSGEPGAVILTSPAAEPGRWTGTHPEF